MFGNTNKSHRFFLRIWLRVQMINFTLKFERRLREFKVHQSITNGSRTSNGLSVFAEINTILDTAKKNVKFRIR